jgi:putative Mg2+ transporter-C (MgtC) family protein
MAWPAFYSSSDRLYQSRHDVGSRQLQGGSMLEHTVDLADTLIVTVKLLMALCLGCLIGVERQWRQRYTGLTTYALVAMGATAYTSLPGLYDTVDLRLAGQVVTGIGFLGAGLIMKEGQSIRGLSTAATVWSTGAVGVLIGYGKLIEAIETAVLIACVNIFLPRFNGFFDRFAPTEVEVEKFYVIELMCADHDAATVRTKLLQSLTARKLRLQSLESHALADRSGVKVEAIVYCAEKDNVLVESLVGELSISPLVFSSSWTLTSSSD